MIEMSSDWYWMQDAEFRFVEAAGLDHPALDTDVVIGKTRWELPSLGALPGTVWEQHRARLVRHEPFSDFIFLRYNRAGELRYLDLTEQLDAEERAHDIERRYRELLDSLYAQETGVEIPWPPDA